MVRLPDGMRDKIAKVAEENGRSMNAEIVFRLHSSFLAEDGPQSDSDNYFINRIIEIFNSMPQETVQEMTDVIHEFDKAQEKKLKNPKQNF